MLFSVRCAYWCSLIWGSSHKLLGGGWIFAQSTFWALHGSPETLSQWTTRLLPFLLYASLSLFYPIINKVPFVALGAGIDVYVSLRFGSELAQNNPSYASIVVPQKPWWSRIQSYQGNGWGMGNNTQCENEAWPFLFLSVVSLASYKAALLFEPLVWVDYSAASSGADSSNQADILSILFWPWGLPPPLLFVTFSLNLRFSSISFVLAIQHMVPRPNLWGTHWLANGAHCGPLHSWVCPPEDESQGMLDINFVGIP